LFQCRRDLDYYETLQAVLADEVHSLEVAPDDATAVGYILLVANESLAISYVAVLQTHSVAIKEITIFDTVHDRIKYLEVAYWNKFRSYIDACTEL
jgi:hypothetical protein